MVSSGQTVTLTVEIRNEGTAVLPAYDLHLWLDDSLAITLPQSFQTHNIGQAMFASQSLAPGESYQQVLVLEVSEMGGQDQVVGLYGLNDGRSGSVRAEVILDVSGVGVAVVPVFG